MIVIRIIKNHQNALSVEENIKQKIINALFKAIQA
jgi:hypothetical protein